MNTITLKCDNCLVEFQKCNYEYRRAVKLGKNRFFCSLKCSGKKCGKEKTLMDKEAICLWCKSPFLYKPLKHYTKKCCSTECFKLLSKVREQERWDRHVPTPRKRWSRRAVCKVCKKEFDTTSRRKNAFCSRECINQGGDYSKCGGYRARGGRGKSGRYKGIWCDSSWELAWVIYSIENNIKFERNTLGFEYEFENKKYKYYPDFRMEDSSYVEIKGYNSKQWEAKKSEFPYQLIVFGKNEIKPFLEYAKNKYGKNFTDLYEERKVIENNLNLES